PRRVRLGEMRDGDDRCHAASRLCSLLEVFSLFGRAAGKPLLQVLGERPRPLCRALSRRVRLGRGTLLRQWPRGTFFGFAVVFALAAGNVPQEAPTTALRQMSRRAYDCIEQRVEPLVLGLGEIVQHIVRHYLLDARMADADAHSVVIVADMGRERAQAV